jgi:hypothetical protein
MFLPLLRADTWAGREKKGNGKIGASRSTNGFSMGGRTRTAPDVQCEVIYERDQFVYLRATYHHAHQLHTIWIRYEHY